MWNCFVDPDSREQLADNLMSLQTSETIYLLTTFANMAQCRTEAETEFIQTIAFGVFEVMPVLTIKKSQHNSVLLARWLTDNTLKKVSLISKYSFDVFL